MTKPQHDVAAKPSVQVIERMFTLLDVLATREEAVAIARECPAAEWATVEVRELAPCYQ